MLDNFLFNFSCFFVERFLPFFDKLILFFHIVVLFSLLFLTYLAFK